MLSIKKVFSKRDKNKCPYSSLYECPYSNVDECDYSKNKCFHLEYTNKKVKKKVDNNTHYLIFLLLGGVILISVSLILEYSKDEYDFMSILVELLNNIGITVIASCILVLILEIPSKIRLFKDVMIEAFTSSKYLDKLTESQLKKLRMDITDKLHKKDVPNMPRGLIELDQQICDLLNKPYYKFYREDVKCVFVDKERKKSKSISKQVYIKKVYNIEFVMHNPYPKSHPVFADLGLSKQLCIDKGEDIEDFFTIDRFLISIDKREFMDIRPCVSIVTDDIFASSEYYNKVLYLYPINYKKLTAESIKDILMEGKEKTYDFKKRSDIKDTNWVGNHQLMIEFCDTIQVKFDYTVYVPITDIHYTHRFRYPVKYYRLDYSCAEDDVEVYGQLISTLLDQSKISSKFSDDGKHISLESFGWLLPRNGILAVISRRAKDNE